VADWELGQKVRIKSMTDVDTKEPEDDTFNLIGRTATIVEAYLNDYYDCSIKLDNSSDIPGTVYGDPAILAFLHCDLEVIE